MAKFGQYNLKKETLEAIFKIGFTEMTPIQEAIIPLVLKKNNILAQSKTGSGKTHAFIIPVIDALFGTTNQALITVPTRELAIQITKEVNKFLNAGNFNIKVNNLIGGTEKELHKKSTTATIIIGTPGRIADMIFKEKVINTKTISFFVIDEADMTLDLGFQEELTQLFAAIKDASIIICSATIFEELKKISKKTIPNLKEIILDPKEIIPTKITHYLVNGEASKEKSLLESLKYFNPYLMLIFVSNKKDINDIYQLLLKNGIKAGVLHGDLEQRERKRRIKEINALKYQYVICSDIAARGIDIAGVSHVVQYDLPKEIEFCLHRAGRTGRNNADGVNIIIYEEKELPQVRRLEGLKLEFDHVKFKKGDLVSIKPIFSREKRHK